MDRRSFCRHLSRIGSGLALASPLVPPLSPDARIFAATETGAMQANRNPIADPFLYILRFAMAPDFHEQERAEALLEFCRAAEIDDVAFILWAEELNTGHPTLEEVEPWMRMVERLKPQLAAQGVTTSLNPWASLLHADRGRVLKAGQKFQLMVDSKGRTAAATACPLCPAWREHMRKHYERLAQIHPRMIWVDDDFRLHNHAPLQWGGCFCDLHLQEYSRRAGRPVGREEFIRGVLQPGAPHPFRRVWLDTSRETMVELSRMLGQAVQRVAPGTRVGLMSSTPAVHCIEGRDWEGVLRGFSAGLPPVNRPHLPSYTEATAPEYLWNFSRISRMSAAMVPADTLLYPELENWPHSRFSKSRAFTRFQIESAAVLGPAGITMDIFDLFGNGALPQEGYAKVLVQAKALSSKLRELKLDRKQELGVEILFNPMASYTLWTEKGESLGELAPDENFWSGFLATMGIAHTYREWNDQQQQVLAISGQYFRGLKPAEIQKLLAENVVLLNGDAIFTLCQMGFSGLLDVRRAEWVAADSGIPSYEQLADGRTYAGLSGARLTAQALTGDYLKIEYAGEAVEHSEVRNYAGLRTGPGMAVVKKHIILLPYGRGRDYQGLRHPVRQALLQELLLELAGTHCPVFLKETANVAVYAYDLGGKRALLLVNASLDDYPELRLSCAGVAGKDAVEISSKGARNLGSSLRIQGNDLVFDSGLQPLEVKALVIPSV